MRWVLRAGALGRPKGMGWRVRWEGGSGWETHVNPWLIHVNVWQKPLQYCKVISLQRIKINGKKNKKKHNLLLFSKKQTTNKQIFSHSFGDWTSMIKAPAELASSEVPPTLPHDLFFVHPQPWCLSVCPEFFFRRIPVRLD